MDWNPSDIKLEARGLLVKALRYEDEISFNGLPFRLKLEFRRTLTGSESPVYVCKLNKHLILKISPPGSHIDPSLIYRNEVLPIHIVLPTYKDNKIDLATFVRFLASWDDATFDTKGYDLYGLEIVCSYWQSTKSYGDVVNFKALMRKLGKRYPELSDQIHKRYADVGTERHEIKFAKLLKRKLKAYDAKIKLEAQYRKICYGNIYVVDFLLSLDDRAVAIEFDEHAHKYTKRKDGDRAHVLVGCLYREFRSGVELVRVSQGEEDSFLDSGLKECVAWLLRSGKYESYQSGIRTGE